VKFAFKVSMKISRILDIDNTREWRDSFPSVLPMQSSIPGIWYANSSGPQALSIGIMELYKVV